MPKLEGIIKSSVQDVLSESMQDILPEFLNEDFLERLKPNSGRDQSQNLTESNDPANLFGGCGCPIGWFRILDSCLWVGPKETILSHAEAYMYCKRKISGGQLFEPRSKVQNDYAKDLVDAIDGEIYGAHLWIGINDHMEEGKFVYSKSEAIISRVKDSYPDHDHGHVITMVTAQVIYSESLFSFTFFLEKSGLPSAIVFPIMLECFLLCAAYSLTL